MEAQNDTLGVLLIEAAKAIRKTFERRANPFGLSSSQWRLLVVLGRLGQASQTRLAETLDIEPISVSRLIDRMETAGWVRRLPDPDDRRAKIIVPTERSREVHARVREIAEQIYADALSTVPTDEHPVLKRALVQIIANLAACNAESCGKSRSYPDTAASARPGKNGATAPSDTFDSRAAELTPPKDDTHVEQP